MVLDAIRRAGRKDRGAIVDALRSVKDFEGALGVWSFTDDGDITQAIISGNVVEAGDFKFEKAL